MTKPTYFNNFPNIKYSVSANKAGFPTNLEVKDFFHLLRIRDDIFKKDTLFYEYYVRNGERPEQIAYKEYGDEQYYWIVLQCNDIVDYYNQWPLSYREMEKFILKKYGSYEAAAEIRHWETVDTYDTQGNLILNGGLVVDETFAYEYPDYPGSSVYGTSLPVSVTHRDYEERLNEKKSKIFLVQRRYIADIMRDVENYGAKLRKQSSNINISDVLK